MRARLLLVPLLAAACTDPSSEPGPQVTLDATGAKFAAVKPDDGDWQVLAEDEDGNFTFAKPETAYALVYVCSAGPFLNVDAILAGPEDGDAWGDICSNSTHKEPLDLYSPLFATLHVGTSTWNVSGNGSFDGPVGVVDFGLHTFTEPPYVALVRDVEIDGPTTVSLGVSDFSVMFLSQLEITGELGNGAHSEPDLTIGQDTMMMLWGIPAPDATSVWLAPPEMLRAGDRQVHLFVSSSAGAAHWVEVDRGAGRSADPVAVTLAGEMQSATLKTDGGTPRIGVVADGDWEVARAEIFGQLMDSQFLRWVLNAKPGWVAAHPIDGAVVFPDVATVEGWNPTWTLGDSNLGWGVRLGEEVDDGVIRGVQYYEPFNPN